jgi:hypothetical protein
MPWHARQRLLKAIRAPKPPVDIPTLAREIACRDPRVRCLQRIGRRQLLR